MTTTAKRNMEVWAQWVTRGMIGILVYLGVEVRTDLRAVKDTIPALQQQIIDMKERQNRMELKLYATYYIVSGEAKKPFQLSNDLKFQP